MCPYVHRVTLGLSHKQVSLCSLACVYAIHYPAVSHGRHSRALVDWVVTPIIQLHVSHKPGWNNVGRGQNVYLHLTGISETSHERVHLTVSFL